MSPRVVCCSASQSNDHKQGLLSRSDSSAANRLAKEPEVSAKNERSERLAMPTPEHKTESPSTAACGPQPPEANCWSKHNFQ